MGKVYYTFLFLSTIFSLSVCKTENLSIIKPSYGIMYQHLGKLIHNLNIFDLIIQIPIGDYEPKIEVQDQIIEQYMNQCGYLDQLDDDLKVLCMQLYHLYAQYENRKRQAQKVRCEILEKDLPLLLDGYEFQCPEFAPRRMSPKQDLAWSALQLELSHLSELDQSLLNQQAISDVFFRLINDTDSPLRRRYYKILHEQESAGTTPETPPNLKETLWIPHQTSEGEWVYQKPKSANQPLNEGDKTKMFDINPRDLLSLEWQDLTNPAVFNNTSVDWSQYLLLQQLEERYLTFLETPPSRAVGQFKQLLRVNVPAISQRNKVFIQQQLDEAEEINKGIKTLKNQMDHLPQSSPQRRAAAITLRRRQGRMRDFFAQIWQQAARSALHRRRARINHARNNTNSAGDRIDLVTMWDETKIQQDQLDRVNDEMERDKNYTMMLTTSRSRRAILAALDLVSKLLISYIQKFGKIK